VTVYSFRAYYACFNMKPALFQIFHRILRVGLGSVFVFSGVVKLGDVSGFAENVGNFGLVYDSLVVPAAWSISLLELVFGLGLIINLRGGLTGILLLLCGFIGTLLYGIGMGLDIECGCFGPSHRVSLKTQLSIDLGLLVWCGLVHWSRKRCGSRTIRLTALFSKAHSHGEPSK